MGRRRDRSDPILREILRKRRESECPAGSYPQEAWVDGIDGLETDKEISFRVVGVKPCTGGPGRRLAHWLFQKGGMTIVLILSLITIIVIGSLFGRR